MRGKSLKTIPRGLKYSIRLVQVCLALCLLFAPIYCFSAWPDGSTGARLDDTIVPVTDPNLVINPGTLPPPIIVRVLDPSGIPLPGVEVEFSIKKNNKIFASAVTQLSNDQGISVFKLNTPLDAGEYNITARLTGKSNESAGRSISFKLKVLGSQGGSIWNLKLIGLIFLSIIAFIAAFVFFRKPKHLIYSVASDQGIPQARVKISTIDGDPVVDLFTNEDGNFFKRLKAGEYRVKIEKNDLELLKIDDHPEFVKDSKWSGHFKVFSSGEKIQFVLSENI